MSGLGLVPTGLTCTAAWLHWPASLCVPAGVLYLLCCTLSSLLWNSFEHLLQVHSISIKSHCQISWVGLTRWEQDCHKEVLWSRLMQTSEEDISEEEKNIQAAQAIQKTTTTQDPGTIPSTSSLSQVSHSIYIHQELNCYGLHPPRILSLLTWELCSAVVQYVCWYPLWCSAWALGCVVGWVSLPLAWLSPRTAFSSAPLL